MTQAVITKKINKAREEMGALMKRSKRKLLELEVLMSLAEIKQGKFAVFKSGNELLRKLK